MFLVSMEVNVRKSKSAGVSTPCGRLRVLLPAISNLIYSFVIFTFLVKKILKFNVSVKSKRYRGLLKLVIELISKFTLPVRVGCIKSSIKRSSAFHGLPRVVRHCDCAPRSSTTPLHLLPANMSRAVNIGGAAGQGFSNVPPAAAPTATTEPSQHSISLIFKPRTI